MNRVLKYGHVINRVENITDFGHKLGKGFKKRVAHPHPIFLRAGLKVNDQLVAYATRFLAVRLKKYMWSHHRALKVKV